MLAVVSDSGEGMQPTRRQIEDENMVPRRWPAIDLVVRIVFAAGCAGWPLSGSANKAVRLAAGLNENAHPSVVMERGVISAPVC